VHVQVTAPTSSSASEDNFSIANRNGISGDNKSPTANHVEDVIGYRNPAMNDKESCATALHTANSVGIEFDRNAKLRLTIPTKLVRRKINIVILIKKILLPTRYVNDIGDRIRRGKIQERQLIHLRLLK